MKVEQKFTGLLRALVGGVVILTVLSCVAQPGKLASTPLPQDNASYQPQTQIQVGDIVPEEISEISTVADTLSAADWPMAGANPQRTSWTSEEVRGNLNPIWYRVIEPYVPPKIQVIAVDGLLYLSTSAGLYAFDAQTGDTVWVYPTKLPLGHSPTIFNGVAYVGGHDHKIHAINAQTGSGIWTFEADAGFDTNPLVLELNGRTFVYAGNRDGAMYALEDHGNTVSLLWKYMTQGPIPFSAAYRDNTLYFASNDAYAYALNVQTGALVWRSSKLPGAGFQVWWPVLYADSASGRDVVMLAGSNNYRFFLAPGFGYDLQLRELEDIFPNRDLEPRGTPFGPRNPDGTLDATRVFQYFEAKPWRRTNFVLDRATGQEVTFDFDGDGVAEYAPVLWHGTHSGNRYPPVVGADGIAYQSNAYMSDEWIAGGQITGWEVGSQSVSTPSAVWIAMDEPMAYSAGGNLIYWSHCNDRSAGAFDISIPNTRHYPSSPDTNREWVYFAYDLDSRLPGYNVLYEGFNPLGYTINNLFRGVEASPNGIYGQHGHQNPPIPHAGRVYIHRSNALIALGDYRGQPTQLPMAPAVAAPDTELNISVAQLREKLAVEVGKMVNAGHLRPGYRSHGLLDNVTRDQIGDYIIDYWHNPADTLYVLALTLPHLPTNMQSQVRTYMQNEFTAYSPSQYTHVGWRDGAPREPYELPREAEVDRVNHPPYVSGYGYAGWTWPPNLFYALWKYAEVFGGAESIFQASRSRLESPPVDAYLIEYPYIHNAYIAGYIGYLELEALAGAPESTNVRTTLNRLLSLRASSFSKDIPYTDGNKARAFSVARNFMFLVPELGQYLRENVLDEVQEAIDEYSRVAPYWFVANYHTAHGESANQHFYDYHALFLAKALILQESGIELVKYLDVPAVQVGDLFYILNLVTVLQDGADGNLEKTVTPSNGRENDIFSYTISFWGSGQTLALTDTLPVGVSAPFNFNLQGTTVAPVYNAATRQLTWTSSAVPEGQQVALQYDVTIVATGPQILQNTVTLDLGTGASPLTAVAVIIVNPYQIHLPVVVKMN